MAQIPGDNAGMENSGGPGALQPDIMGEIQSESFAIIADLTSLQQKVVIALVRNTLSDDIRSDADIATECDTTRAYIWQLRQNPRFARALGLLVRDIVRGTQDKALTLLWKHAEKDPSSVKLLLEIGGTYERTQRNLNINASISGGQGQSMGIDDSIDSILIRLGELGWNASRVAQLSERFSELKAEGAF